MEVLGDLERGEASPFAQEERLALALRKRRESLAQLAEEPGVLVGRRLGDGLDLDGARHRAPRGRALLPAADVACDRVQPGGLGLRHDAAAERAERAEERDLHRVLRLRAGAQLLEAEREQALGVLRVQPLGGRVVGGAASPRQGAALCHGVPLHSSECDYTVVGSRTGGAHPSG